MDAYAALEREPEFENLVAARYTWIIVEEYEDAIAFADRVPALVAADLERP